MRRPLTDGVQDLPGRGVVKAVDGAAQTTSGNLDDVLRGSGKVALGGLQALTPAVIPAGIEAPAVTAAYLALSHGLSGLGTNLASKAGASPEDAQEIGDVAGAAPIVYGAAKEGLSAFAEQRAAITDAIAQKWQALGDALEPARAAAGASGDPIPVALKGPNGTRAGSIELAGVSGSGRPFLQVLADGKTVYAGTGEAVTNWLNQRAADPTWLQKWNQSRADAGLDTPVSNVATVKSLKAASDVTQPQAILADPGVTAEPTPPPGFSEPQAPPPSRLTQDAARVGAALTPPPEEAEAGVAEAPQPEPTPAPASTVSATVAPSKFSGTAAEREAQALAYAQANPDAKTAPLQRRFGIGYGAAQRVLMQASPAPAEQNLPAAGEEPAIPAGFHEEQPVVPAGTPTAPTNEDGQKAAAVKTPASGVAELPVSQIQADPARFQFKADTGGKAGVGDELKQIRTFNPDLAGVISVWRDPADGQTYVVNGHHRLELAQRTGAPTIPARYIQAADAGEARQTGALINIAEGRGTAIDAAKVFRESAATPQQIEDRVGVSLKGAVARDGVALSRLAPSIFDRVVQGDLPVQRAAIIGETLPDHGEQKAAIDLLDKAEAKGRGLTNPEARELIRFVKEAPRTEQQAQNFSLFGEDTITKNLALEKAEVSSYIKQQLASTKKIFALTGTAGNAQLLGKTGNVIKAEENARMAEATAQVQAVYDKLSLSAGPIADALNQAAEDLAQGKKSPLEVKQNALERIRTAVKETFSRSQPAGGERSGSPSESGARAHGEAPGEVREVARESGEGAEGERPGEPPSVTPRLPRDLAGAKPRYGYGSRNFELTFEDDRDRAAYIAAQEKPSKKDAAYVAWMRRATGLDEQAIRARGADVRAAVKALARSHPEDQKAELTVPSSWDSGEAANQGVKLPSQMGGERPGEPRDVDGRDAAQSRLSDTAKGRPKNAIQDVMGGKIYSANAPLRQQLLESRGFIGEQAGHPATINVNRQAFVALWEALSEGASADLDIGDPVRAVCFSPAGVKDIHRTLKAWLRKVDSENGEGVRQITHLLALVQSAAADDDGRVGSLPMIVFNPDTAMGPRVVAAILAEERAHYIQAGINGTFSDHLDSAGMVRFFRNPQARIARRFLEQKGYPSDDLDSMLVEIGARLMIGRWKDLGLKSRAEASALGLIYSSLLKEHNGDRASKVINAVARTYPELKRSLGIDQAVRSKERQSRGGGSSSATARYQRPADARERSLFEPDENDAVAKSAARDRDQLEGERLTAQLNAPLTREEQLKKLKRSKDKPQTSLFGDDEEPTAQGSFVLASGFGALQPYIEKFLDDKVVPSAKQAGEVLQIAKTDLLKLLAPGAVPGAKDAHLIVRQNAAELARSTDRAEAALQVAGKFFAQQTPKFNYDFMDRMERGVAQRDPALNGFAKLMRTMLDERRDAVQSLGTKKLEHFIEDYFPHIWENTREARTIFMNLAKRPLEGSKNFLEERTIDSIAQGLALGLKPISDNPVDLVLLKLREMDKYLMAHHALADLEAAGQLTFHRANVETPQGYSKIDDKVATVYVAASKKGAVQIQGYWVAPEPAARVLNNFLSPGLRDKSALYRGFLGASNILNQAQLGLSAFHLAFTTMDVATSKLALAIYQLAHGDVWKAAKSAALTPLSPFLNIVRGDKMLKEWYAPGTQGLHIGELVDAAVEAGGRAHMDSFYETQITKNMMKAFRAHQWFLGGIRVPFAAIEQAARPIMEYLVPRQKMGVFADLAQYELERLGPQASEWETKAALARAWDSVDNRLGQLVYDNLAWHKATKDIAMLSVRSVGWNVGTIREVGGGGLDALKFAGNAARRLTGNGGPAPEPTPKMSYLLALQIMGGLIGFGLYYLWHGHAPKHLKDYYFPTDSQGHRWSLPSYVKDEYAWAHDPAHTAAGKLNPFLTLLWEELTQKDYFDHPIHNPHDSLVKQAEEEAEFLVKQFLPIGLRPDESKHPRVPASERRAYGFVGVTPAPKSLDQIGQ